MPQVIMRREEKYPPACPYCGNTLFRVKIEDESVMDYDFDEEKYCEHTPQRCYICFYCNEDVTDVILDFLLEN
jgi:ribosomal protein L34E